MRVKKQFFSSSKPLLLESGKKLSQYQIAFETYGRLDSSAGNAILVCHTLVTDCHVAGRYDSNDLKPGWWDDFVGPGKTLDTEKYFVVCMNVLGGCGGSSGPSSSNPATGEPYGLRFPVVTVADMVAAQVEVSESLGITCYKVIIGGCLGGFQVLEWLRGYPARCECAVVISASLSTTAHNLGLWEVFRQAVIRDPGFNNGDYYTSASAPLSGPVLISLFGMMIWMSRDVMDERFGLKVAGEGQLSYDCLEADFEFQAFLRTLSESAPGRFDVNSLLYLWKAMDYFDLTRSREDLAAIFKDLEARILLVSYRSDWRYPPSAMERVKVALQTGSPAADIRHEVLNSRFGHGAFIYDSKKLSGMVSTFLK